MKISNKVNALAKDERGLSTVEYVLLLALVAVACIGAWQTFGGTIISKVDEKGSKIDAL